MKRGPSEIGGDTQPEEKKSKIAHGPSFYDYVSKNKKLPLTNENLLNTPSGQNLLDTLCTAIDHQNFKHELFKHPDLLSMIQSLYETKRIDENQRLTLFIYMTALQSHTTWQEVSDIRAFKKELLDVEYITPNHQEYEALLDEYLDNLLQKMDEYRPEKFYSGVSLPSLSRFDKAAIKKLLIHFPLAEQGFITIKAPEYWDFNVAYDLEKPNQMTDAEILFLFLSTDANFLCGRLVGKRVCVIPSMSFFNLLSKQINPDYCKTLVPILGSIKPIRMYNDFIKQDMQPVSIHCKDILSNMKNVHGFLKTPINIVIHDISHAIATLQSMSKSAYHFYKNELLPFWILLEKAFNVNEKSIPEITEWIERINDLSGLPSWSLVPGLFKAPPEVEEIVLLSALISAEYNKNTYGMTMGFDASRLKEKCTEKYGADKVEKIVTNFSQCSLSSLQLNDIKEMSAILNNASTAGYFNSFTANQKSISIATKPDCEIDIEKNQQLEQLKRPGI